MILNGSCRVKSDLVLTFLGRFQFQNFVYQFWSGRVEMCVIGFEDFLRFMN